MTEAEGRAVLLSAATEIVERTGSANFTVRQVAARAGINHGLVHRYFGTKDALVEAVIVEIDASVAQEMAAGAGLDEFNHDGAVTLARLVAHTMLSERSLDEHSDAIDIRQDRNDRSSSGRASSAAASATPGAVAELLVQRCREASAMSEQEARVAAAQIMALVMGWRLNEAYLVRTCGLGDHEIDVLRKELLETCVRLAHGASQVSARTGAPNTH